MLELRIRVGLPLIWRIDGRLNTRSGYVTIAVGVMEFHVFYRLIGVTETLMPTTKTDFGETVDIVMVKGKRPVSRRETLRQ